MANRTSRDDVNQSLTHRGVTFSVTRTTAVDAPPAFRWVIYPQAEAGEGAASGIADGRGAFARAYAAAQSAIDAWLAAKGEAAP